MAFTNCIYGLLFPSVAVVYVQRSGDIKVRFYDDSQWEDYATFTDDDVHKTVSHHLIQHFT